MADPEDVAVREAVSGAHSGDSDDAPRHDGRMPKFCGNCGRALTPTGAVGGGGVRIQQARCLTCRVKAVGAAAFVTLFTDELTDAVEAKFRREQKRAGAQSPFGAAVYLDPGLDRVTPAYYEVRRVHPKALSVTWADGHLTSAQAASLAEHYRLNAGDTWDVHTKGADLILLVDRGADDREQIAADAVDAAGAQTTVECYDCGTSVPKGDVKKATVVFEDEVVVEPDHRHHQDPAYNPTTEERAVGTTPVPVCPGCYDD